MRAKRFGFMAFLCVSVVLSMACFTFAAPSLDITKGPVTSALDWTGPMIDPPAKQGQWFLDLNVTGQYKEEVRTHEFYDNVPDLGGGTKGSAAIEGIPVNIQIDGTTGNIVAFSILTTITNDTPGIGQWRDGTNSHEEDLVTDIQYEGTMYDTKLTAEFAVEEDSFNGWLNTLAGISLDDTPYSIADEAIIFAEEVDQLGWYCWTPENEAQLQPYGNYLVPTYDFGDIAPGQSVTRTLNFQVNGGGITPNDPRFEVLSSDQDIFLNRTTSLKISNWIEELGIDDGSPYPTDTSVSPMARLNSDVSVFHNVPEPSTMVLLTLAFGCGLLLKLRRRK